MEEPKKFSPAVRWGALLVLVLAVVAYGAWKYVKRENSTIDILVDDTSVAVPEETPTSENLPPSTPMMVPKMMPPKNTMMSFSYKDGTYSAMGDYFSPGGEEQIGVTLTLKDDVIVDASVVSKAENPNSIKFQGIFVSNFKPLVVGKKISDVNLTKVSGSSLTPKGFNDALAKIKVQSQV